MIDYPRKIHPSDWSIYPADVIRFDKAFNNIIHNIIYEMLRKLPRTGSTIGVTKPIANP